MKQDRKEMIKRIEECEILPESTKKTTKRNIELIAIFLTIVSAFLIIYTITNLEPLQNEFSSQVKAYGFPALLFLSLLLELVPQLISPIAILTTAIFAGLNPHIAILTTITGSTIGSIIGFSLGKKYVCAALGLLANKRSIKKTTELTNKYGKIIIPIAAISPLPYLPVVFGAMNFSRKNFLIYGIIPRALSFIIFGYLIRTI